MYSITDQHIDYILNDLAAKGVKIPDLQQNLLDHICILIEQNLEPGEDLEAYYQSILPSFYRENLAEIEAEAQFLLRHRRRWVVLGRGQFLLGLFVLVTGPFITYDLCWFLRMGRLPLEVWGGTVVFMQFPFLIWLVLAFTPDRFDPLLPRGAKVLLGWRPFISIL
ncbi:MAG TPA: hypothetical protein VL978_06985 [Puia sp.]|nr:hypothetical protein [Puia sp.]